MPIFVAVWIRIKAIGQPLGSLYKGAPKPQGNAQRLLDRTWAIFKGYLKAAAKLPIL
jgi:hypothetical protein